MKIRLRCPREHCGGRVTAAMGSASATSVTCARCGSAVAIPRRAGEPAAALETCPRCGGREFFVRRDFPQRLGLAVVIFAALASCIAFALERMILTWSILTAAVVIDALLYLVTGTVTVCYRCRAEFEDAPYNASHHGFDLATSEKYGEYVP